MKRNAKAEQWKTNFQAKRKKMLEERDEKGAAMTSPIQPQTLFKVLRGVLPANSIVTIDAGTCVCRRPMHSIIWSRRPS